MNILVVADERALANHIAEILFQNGYRALPLYDRIEALKHAQRMTFDMALIGYTKGIFIIELGDKLRELMPDCEVILMVGEAIIDVMRSGRRDFDFMPVPIKPQDLLKMVRKVDCQQGIDSLFRS